VMRLHRAKGGPKLFSPEEIRNLLDIAGVPMRAMILLAANGGFGNTDCARLPLSAVDLEGGIIDYPRPKTGIARRCVLWPETVAALREVIARRPTPKHEEDEGLVFITRRGLSWSKAASSGPVSHAFRKLVGKLGRNGHRNFYTIRHTFRTIADEAKDQPAADFVMGHESSHMSTVYRERIPDGRLRAVVDHVRSWLLRGKKDGRQP
jgi:integrase